jgi:hypothetical protein
VPFEDAVEVRDRQRNHVFKRAYVPMLKKQTTRKDKPSAKSEKVIINRSSSFSQIERGVVVRRTRLTSAGRKVAG